MTTISKISKNEFRRQRKLKLKIERKEERKRQRLKQKEDKEKALRAEGKLIPWLEPKKCRENGMKSYKEVIFE